jgi:phosphoribosylformylglycinamidine (FGAM) synthase-like amidotransferase family enzyme
MGSKSQVGAHCLWSLQTGKDRLLIGLCEAFQIVPFGKLLCPMFQMILNMRSTHRQRRITHTCHSDRTILEQTLVQVSICHCQLKLTATDGTFSPDEMQREREIQKEG